MIHLEAELAVAAETTATLAAQQQILKDKLAAEQDKVAAAARAELHLSGDNSRMASLLEKMEAQFEKMEAASAACVKPSPLGTPQLLCEQEISEDIELGSRMHARGWKSVFIKQNLATGEVRIFV